MSSSKAVGTRWETAIVNYLRPWWPLVGRRPLAGRYDKGDVGHGPQGWTIECKNQAKMNLPLWLRQAKVEARNNGDPWYVVIAKNRRGTVSTGATADAFAVMPLLLWAELVHEVERLRLAVSPTGGLPAGSDTA